MRDSRGNVVNRLRYVFVFGSLEDGIGLGEGVSKYGERSSYNNGSAIFVRC